MVERARCAAIAVEEHATGPSLVHHVDGIGVAAEPVAAHVLEEELALRHGARIQRGVHVHVLARLDLRAQVLGRRRARRSDQYLNS
jgi:hypothetical protein